MTNCLFFALALFFRRFAKGRRCYVQIRKSDGGWYPHFIYSEQRLYAGRKVVRQISYKPLHPRKRLLPPLVFRGAARWGD